MENDKSSTFTLLQPELLNENELKEILISRCVSRNLDNCTKNELVELFRSIALPLPQRQYGESRRERLLSRKQQRRRRISLNQNETGIKLLPSKPTPERSSHKEVTKESSTSLDRLKPPPDKINYERKVIKLSDSAKKRINNELDKIMIKNKPAKDTANSSLDKEEAKKGIKKKPSPIVVITVQGEDGKPVPPSIPNLAIKLKRSSIDAQDQETADKQVDEKQPRQKRPRIRISWN